jgi:hypothetical protein
MVNMRQDGQVPVPLETSGYNQSDLPVMVLRAESGEHKEIRSMISSGIFQIN